MRMLFVCLIYASGAAAVLFLLVREWKNPWRIYGGLFGFFLFTSYLKLKLEYSGIYTLILYVLLIGLIGFLTNKMLDKPFRFIARIFCLNMAIACLGDLIAFLVIRYLFRYQTLPSWNEPGGMEAIITSNLSQVLLAGVYGVFPRKKQEKGREEEQFSVIMSVMATQTLILLWCMIFVRMQLERLPYMVFIFAGFQGILGVLLLYWVRMAWKESSLLEKRERLAMLEKENAAVYAHYQEMGQAYASLHKLQHDFNNLMNTASFLAGEGEIKKAEQMFADVESMLKEAQDDRSAQTVQSLPSDLDFQNGEG